MFAVLQRAARAKRARAIVAPVAAALVLLLGWFVPVALPFAHGAGGTIDVSEIRPGMRGYGLTVFRGTRPTRFDVEVIDVLHNFRPDQHLILVRTEHPVLEKALVVGGMSGSPIYLDGKLAGAYAYGWMFGKEPVAGVTPISSMLAELKRPVDPAIWKALGTLPLPMAEDGEPPAQPVRPTRLSGLPTYLGRERTDALQPLRQHASVHGHAADAGAGAGAGLPLRRASTPLMLSGLTDQTVRLLGDQLDDFGLVALQAGGGARKPRAGVRRTPKQFVDGGAIGVQLVRGDINATAIGTVTHVAGNRLVGFGHPMMNAGQPALPTSTANVLHVFASERRSFKIAEAVDPLGTLIHDRQAGIVVDTRLRADAIPLKVRISGVPGAPRSEWNVEVASQRMLTPLLTLASAFNALSVTAAEHSDVVFSAKSRVRVQGHGTIEVEDHGHAHMGFGNPAALSQLRIFDVLSAAYGNPFEDVRIEAMEIDLAVRFERDVVTVLDALVAATEVDPGSDVNVYLTLQRFGQPEEVRIVPVHVPEIAAGEKVEIAFEPGDQVALERPIPKDLAQIFDNVRLGHPATSLVVSTKLPGRGLKLRGHVVHGLPGSAFDMLQLTSDSSHPKSFATYTREELAMNRIVQGKARVTLNVRERKR